ncbi:MAG TPA: NAD(P)H-dependent oxidoreductase [Candidatus Eremiobacteraceae bacterium]|nr:NAD(P)H-dependent oxidoreductase [Candidatus Eremiobacteraceae bacterium]
MSEKIKIGVIYGSTRPGRFCDTVARWVVDQIFQKPEFEVAIIDPASGGSGAEAEKPGHSLRERIADADAFVVVTPEYNHGYPAALKSLIDSFGSEWHAKPVGFVSYGGVSGGLRAVEQLRQVFAELHAVTIRDSVSFASAWELFDSDGALKSPERPLRQLEAMLKRLKWWAETLRNGREAVPYSAAA